MSVFLDKLAKKICYFWYRFVTLPATKKRLKFCGKNVSIGRYSEITCENVSIGNNTYLGPHTTILSTRANVYIGADCMFGPNVTIVSGDHRIDLVGRKMITVKDFEKTLEDDIDVVIKDDVWIGTNVTILKGVIIGTGSVIAAGAVVTKSIPEYSIAGGVPAKVIRPRFLDADLKRHKEIVEGNNK